MMRARFHLAVALAVAAGGCASVRQTMSGWFGGEPPTPAAATPVSAAQGQTYYAGVDGLAVFAEPASSSKVVGRLALYEKVSRSRLEHGYALVSSAKGLEGWVDNAQLLWRVPAATPVKTEAPAAATGGAAGGEGAATAPPTATPETPAASPPTPAAPPPTPEAAPTAPAPGRKLEPSIFDPY